MRAPIASPKRSRAIKLTLLTAAIVGAAEPVFGLAAAWADRASSNFAARTCCMTLIDLPFAVSPVIAGLIFVLLFGRAGLVRRLAGAITGSRSSSRCPGIVLATMFVTFPFVARELIPLMEAQGTRRGGGGARRSARAVGRRSVG